MIILDTNVLSALMRSDPEKTVVAWLDQQPRTSIWTTSITVLEIRFGLQIMAAGRRRASLIQAFAGVLEAIEHRIIPFDFEAAERAGDLLALRRKKGRTAEYRDTMIAGVAIAHHATLATRNVKDFDDVSIPVVNPWGDA